MSATAPSIGTPLACLAQVRRTKEKGNIMYIIMGNTSHEGDEELTK